LGGFSGAHFLKNGLKLRLEEKSGTLFLNNEIKKRAKDVALEDFYIFELIVS